MIFEYKKKIYGYECDVYGHLNNAIYLQIFEAARCEALKDVQMPLGKLKDDGIMMFVVRAEVDYKKGVMLDDEIVVKSRIDKHDRLCIVWLQEIFNLSGALCSSALIRIVYVKDYKPSRISKELFEFFDKFCENSELKIKN